MTRARLSQFFSDLVVTFQGGHLGKLSNRIRSPKKEDIFSTFLDIRGDYPPAALNTDANLD